MSYNRKLLISLAVLVLIVVGAYSRFSKKETRQGSIKEQLPIATSTPTPVHEHASFAVFTNGIKRDFKDPKYHELNRSVHISPDNPEIVHKHKSGITWSKFFDTLPKPMKIAKNCLTTGTGQEYCNTEKAKLKFYLNGKLANNALDLEIKDRDRLLVSFGVENETEVRKQFLQVETPPEE